ncbi:hypothetical protein JL721_475 [Aureococcus anophagefferens]|nr:hypothetical protein JL721_475 [Aureococcus anophagefferens]
MDALGDALCGCGDDAVELDERDDLPPTLSAYVINAMQAPHEVLDVHPKAPPWATRDNLRVNCLRLLARRERHFEAYVFRALAAHDATHGCPGLEPRPDRAARRARRARAARGARDEAHGGPRAAAAAARGRRPLRRVARRRAARAAAARRAAVPPAPRVRPVGDALRRRALGVGPGPHGDPRVRLRGVLLRPGHDRRAPAAAVADALARLQATELRELRLVDAASYRALKPLCRVRGLLQRARKQEDFRRRKTPTEIGRVLARRFMALHRSLGLLLGAYSPALLEGLLRVDVDRVWREEEPRVARSLDPPRPTDPSDVLYLVDEEWLRAWRSWAFYAPPRAATRTRRRRRARSNALPRRRRPRCTLASTTAPCRRRSMPTFPSATARPTSRASRGGARTEPPGARRRAPGDRARAARCPRRATGGPSSRPRRTTPTTARRRRGGPRDATPPVPPPPLGGETTCCTPAPKPPDPEAGVELPTLSPLHDALREA